MSKQTSRKPAPDLSTPEARRAAVQAADITTPGGRALVRKAQRAAEQAVTTSVSLSDRWA